MDKTEFEAFLEGKLKEIIAGYRQYNGDKNKFISMAVWADGTACANNYAPKIEDRIYVFVRRDSDE